MKNTGIWHFISLMFLIYGAIIFINGMYFWTSQGALPSTSLNNLHPSVWWGLLMLFFGGLIFYLNFKRK
jgi:uncharacterized membrane protein YbhN (UPF0104 family)